MITLGWGAERSRDVSGGVAVSLILIGKDAERGSAGRKVT